MKARPAYRNRKEVEVGVLDALVDRGREGMTVLELRASVDADIDTIEIALEDLKQDNLIAVSQNRGTMVIKPDERVIPDPDAGVNSESILERIRNRLPF